MDSINLQQQLSDNSAGLQEFSQDIKAWGEQWKSMEKPPQIVEENLKDKQFAHETASKRDNNNKFDDNPTHKSKKPKDFSYWEKFDAEAECEKVDNEDNKDDSDLSDQFDEGLYESAKLEKDKGNKFVKVGNWEEAIKAYTKAIKLYGYDQTFYCNRSLCYLKLMMFENAESDCNFALQLDNTYVKALHRRALAREGLKEFHKAKEDLVKVLEIEPENKESQKILDKIEAYFKTLEKKPKSITHPSEPTHRPVSKFAAGRSKLSATYSKNEPVHDGPAFTGKVIEHKKTDLKALQKASLIKNTNNVKVTDSIPWPAGHEVEIINTSTKSSKQTKVPLRRIPVTETLSKINILK